MITRIPKDNKWTQNNRSDIFGSLWVGMNLDLESKVGKTRVSPRMKITTNDTTNLGVAVGFERFNGGSGKNGLYTIAGDRAFYNGAVDAATTFGSSEGATTHSADTADIMFFKRGNKLVSSLQTSLQSNAGAGWSTVAGSPLTSGTVHMLTEYGVRGYVTDNYKTVISFDTSMNTTAAGNANTFSLGTLDLNNIGLFFSDIKAASDRIWMFTINGAVGIPARTYTWDGATQDDPTNEYIHEHNGVVASVIKNDRPIIMSVEGYLEEFTGGTFTKIENGRLPINPDKFLKNSLSSVNDRWIHPNGMMVTEDDKINILINNVYEDGTIEERMPSGIWEFDLKNKAKGWYHIYSLSNYSSSILDYGQNRVSRVGGLYYAKTPTGTGTLLAGAQIYSNASSTKEIISTNDTVETLQKYGYVVTQKIYSPGVEDTWQRVYLRHKKLLNSSDKLVVKFRTSEIDPTEATITWTDTNTFTTTTDVSAYVVGDEVEIVQGDGSGKTAHITAISANAGTYTVDLDDTFTGVTTNTAKARFQKWTKCKVEGTNQAKLYHEFKIETSSPWIQLKVCMQFTGENELDDILLVHETTKSE